MGPTILGVVLDSSVLIAAERRRLTPAQAIESVHQNLGEIPIVLCALTVAEIGHGIYRAATEEMRNRRRAFLDELKATVPMQPVTGATAVELGYAVATGNLRDFNRIPGVRVVQV